MNDLDFYEGDALGINANDLITLTARLAQILAEEADLLAEMKVSKIEALQKEKILITAALEKQKKYIEQDPRVLHSLSGEEREDLRGVSDVFNAILRENHHRLLVAREVNQKVVEAIAQVAGESATRGFYDDKGSPESFGREALCVTLNKTV